MTDSMNFGPEWLRNLSSEGTTGVNSGGIRYQLAEYRYGREEMLALFEKGIPAPSSLSVFSPLYSEQSLPPLALVPPSEEDRQWQVRGSIMGPSVRGGRGAVGPGERGGRIARGGRGGYQPFGRSTTYETGGGGWGNGEQTEWSPRKEFNYSRSSAGGVDNWRRGTRAEDDDGWRSGGGGSHPTKPSEKWGRSSSWREGDDERIGPQDRSGRSWSENPRAPPQRRMWDDDHLPEWATVNLGEGGGTFDATGAFHGSDDEQDGKGGTKKEPLQKSASQHNITSKTQHVPLSTSKSALSLSKPPEPPQIHQDQSKELCNHIEEIEQKSSTIETEYKKEHEESPHSPLENRSQPIQEEPEKMIHQVINQNSNNEDPQNRVDEDFDKLQEDLVLKLVVDEEPTNSAPHVPHSNGVQPPPPNMMPPLQQDKWYYQDPQGDLQGPFLSSEMAEWFKAGYFSATLFVRRQCDERFCTLGDLVLHTGGNPFQTNVPMMAIKQEPKVPDEMLQYHQLMQAQLQMRARPYGQGEPWNTLNTLQQRELLSQQILQQPQMPPEPYLQQPNGSALLQMINQFQANQVKMNVPPPLVEKPPNTLPIQLDPLQALVQQMGGLQSLQRGMQPPGNMTQVMGPPTGMKHEPPMPPLHGMPVNGLPGTTVPVLPNNNMMGGMPKLGMTKMDGDGNMSFLQFLQKPQMEQSIDLESLWRKNQFPNSQPNNPSPPQVPQWQPSDKPISMWDMPTPPNIPSTPPEMPSMNNDGLNLLKEKSLNEQSKDAAKEERKKKEAEEKRAKKEAEEKRKAEQKKLEAEKKQQEEKRKKEEDRVKKELEKAKKESEEKRQRELAEKRRLKEQRKADEEARKKSEEQKKMEEQERDRLAAKERDEQQKKQAEYTRQVMASNQKLTRAAPWSQSASNQGLSLSEIQKLEKERKAEQVALLQQQRMQQQEQMPSEKPANLQLNWANKPVKQSQVKSLAEIQAEEQERLMKVKATEKAHQKEKETFSPPASRIWQGQTLTWTNNDSNTGFWDEPQQKPQVKVNSEPKMVKQNSTAVPKQVAIKAKKPKKEEQPTNNNNTSTTDEFTEWCSKTLANMDTKVDIPTFVTFLRDIESAMDVREYCRDYLGDKPATQQFAAQFLEKRRLYRPKATTHKDDMCSPAPAITPSSQHNNSDFQEVKGKGKKCKKSKMLKVDARILGFNVTAAEDRINVGARDYGDTI